MDCIFDAAEMGCEDFYEHFCFEVGAGFGCFHCKIDLKIVSLRFVGDYLAGVSYIIFSTCLWMVCEHFKCLPQGIDVFFVIRDDDCMKQFLGIKSLIEFKRSLGF